MTKGKPGASTGSGTGRNDKGILKVGFFEVTDLVMNTVGGGE